MYAYSLILILFYLENYTIKFINETICKSIL